MGERCAYRCQGSHEDRVGFGCEGKQDLTKGLETCIRCTWRSLCVALGEERLADGNAGTWHRATAIRASWSGVVLALSQVVAMGVDKTASNLGLLRLVDPDVGAFDRHCTDSYHGPYKKDMGHVPLESKVTDVVCRTWATAPPPAKAS